MTWRQLSVYLNGLPRDSATAREVGGPDLEWGLAEHLLAFIGDGIQVGNWQRAHGKGKKPQPVPRPGVERGEKFGKTTRNPEDVKKYLARFAPRREEAGGGD